MTRTITLTFAALALASTATPGMAAQTMDASQLGALIAGNTLYVEIPKGAPGAPDGGMAPIFYATDGGVAAQLPGGPKLVGTWAIDGDQYCIDWTNGPQNSCTQLVRDDAGFVVIDVKEGAPRGRVTRFATGNPENL